LAGRPGDRWAGLRKKAGREESPDTVVFNVMGRGRKSLAWRLRRKGNAPGNARGLVFVIQLQGGDSATESATENKPPEQFASVTPLEGNLQQV